LLLGCGGGDKKEDTKQSSPNSPAASQTSTGSSTPASSGASSLSTAGSKLADLDSYRYNLKMSGQGGPLTQLSSSLGGLSGAGTPTQNVTFEVDGAYVKPDKAQMTMSIGTLKITRTVIGKQEWSGFGGINTGPTTATSTAPEELSLAVAFWDEGFLASAKDFKCSGNQETVNGIQTRKCSIDKETFQKLSNLGGGLISGSSFKELSSFAFDAWLAERKGYPVRFRAEMKGKDTDSKDFNFNVSLDLTDINKTIEIKPPS